MNAPNLEKLRKQAHKETCDMIESISGRIGKTDMVAMIHELSDEENLIVLARVLLTVDAIATSTPQPSYHKKTQDVSFLDAAWMLVYQFKLMCLLKPRLVAEN